VTGGATGIGLAIARALADAGARVAVADLDAAGAERAAAEIGQGAFGVVIDVRKRDSVEPTLAAIAEKLGGYQILCANAGVSTMNLVADLTDEEWDFNFDVNARGVFLTNQTAVRYFLKTGTKGVIVNTASLAAKWGAPWLAHYSASKFAVMGFTQALAREMAPHGIRVNCVCPGFVKTGMQSREVEWEAKLRGMTPKAVIDEYIAATPLGRLEAPEDVAKAVLFLCSDLSGFITGESLNVTGGVRMD
jgi:NAD(P)-dependent dehydrogenase (short-subunit alcohol dehydrogenase family)